MKKKDGQETGAKSVFKALEENDLYRQTFEDLPDNPDHWPQAWREEFYTLSGHINDDRSMTWEEADRIAEKELRRRHGRGNYSWQR